MAIVNPYLSIITSHVNGFNQLNKTYRVAECIKKKIQLYAEACIEHSIQQ